MDTRPLVLGCAADHHYALPLAVMLRSAADNLDSRISLEAYIVDGGIEARTRARISASMPERVKLRWIAPQRFGFVDLPLWGRMTLSTYDKLTIGRWLPQTIDRALWLDCDLLVLADLKKLCEAASASYIVAAAQDTLVPTLGARFGVACRTEYGLDADAAYFNAGVMLIDMARWRSEDVAGRALDYLKRHRRRVYFWDQEALNAVIARDWSRLDPRWNWTYGSPRAFPAAVLTNHRPWIFHFTGSLKPWRFEGRSPLHKLYYQYLDSTAWAGWRPENSWRNNLLSRYESSRLRRVIYPLERLAMEVERAATLRYATAKHCR